MNEKFLTPTQILEAAHKKKKGEKKKHKFQEKHKKIGKMKK